MTANLYRQIFDSYSSYYETSDNKFCLVKKQLSNQSDRELIDRKNFIGHFTASAFVITKAPRRVLLIHHTFLKKYLQPGGHIEVSDNTPLDAAARELAEESGVDIASLKYHCVSPLDRQVPFNIDIHSIPENKKKQEAAHYHYDMQYLFLSEKEPSITIDKSESSSFEWVEWSQFKEMAKFRDIANKIEDLMEPSPRRFLSDIARKQQDISCIAIQHIVRNSLPFIYLLDDIFRDDLTIFAKPNSIDQSVWDELKSAGIKLRVAKRDPDNAELFFGIKDKPTILLDIGGYFAKLAAGGGLPIIGIVEDTENGHQKYNSIISKVKYPVFSVARNPLKESEDFLVGSGIVFGASYMLRLENTLLNYMKVSCIGYGKIGRGICAHLRSVGVTPTVIEKNPLRSIIASRDGNNIALNPDLSATDIVFCATGSHSLDIHNFRSMKNGLFIVVATSSEDEFLLDYLSEEYQKTKIGRYITKYKNDNNYFYMLNDGIPPNFAVGSALDNYIFLTHATIIESINEVLRLGKNAKTGVIYELTDSSNRDIATKWLNEFHP